MNYLFKAYLTLFVIQTTKHQTVCLMTDDLWSGKYVECRLCQNSGGFSSQWPGLNPRSVMWDLWWKKWNWQMFLPINFVSLPNYHSTKWFTSLIYHSGLAQWAIYRQRTKGLALRIQKKTVEESSHEWKRSYPGIWQEEMRKTIKSTRTVGVLGKIWTRQLLNTSRKCYHLSQLAQ